MKENDQLYEPTEEIDYGIENLALIDDIFFSFILNDNIELAEDLLEPVFKDVLGEELGKIVSVKTQVANRHLGQRGVIYDAIVITEDGRVINLEVEKDNIFEIERSNYYEASYQVDNLKVGEDFKELKYYHIVFSNRDTAGRGNMVEVIESYYRDHKRFNDGKTWVYLSIGDYNFDPEHAKLKEKLTDFIESDPEKIKGEVIKKAHKSVKENKEVKMQLTEAMERELNRRRAKDAKRIKELENELKILKEQQRKDIQNSKN